MSVPHSVQVNHCIRQIARRGQVGRFGFWRGGFVNRRLIDRFEHPVEQYIRPRW